MFVLDNMEFNQVVVIFEVWFIAFQFLFFVGQLIYYIIQKYNIYKLCKYVYFMLELIWLFRQL